MASPVPFKDQEVLLTVPLVKLARRTIRRLTSSTYITSNHRFFKIALMIILKTPTIRKDPSKKIILGPPNESKD